MAKGQRKGDGLDSIEITTSIESIPTLRSDHSFSEDFERRDFGNGFGRRLAI